MWQEIQTVQLASGGSYSVLLGAASETGLPIEIFSSSEARWLGVRPDGQAEQPRILLLSVAYALKAADTDMLGGKPASAFQLVVPESKSGNIQMVQPPTEQPNEIVCLGSAACKTSFIPMFSSNGGSAKVSDSIITQSGTTIRVAGSEKVSGNLS